MIGERGGTGKELTKKVEAKGDFQGEKKKNGLDGNTVQ